MVVVVGVQVFEFVKLAELYYAGSHGMDIKGPAKGSRHTKAAKVPIHPFQPLFLPLPHRLRPPERGKILILLLCPSVWLTGQRRSLSAGQPVPAHDRAGKTLCLLFDPSFSTTAMLNLVKFLVCLSLDHQVHDSLVEKTKCIPGAKVENNKFCVSVHFRCVDEKVVGHTVSSPFLSIHIFIYIYI